jgi:glycosyltransferase involved in cell wall biosynthesis
MNILFLYASTIDPIKGGIQRVTHVLSSYFDRIGYTTYYMGLKETSQVVDDRQYYLPDSTAFTTSVNRNFFLSFLKEKKIDIVINQGGLGPQTSEFAYLSHQVVDVKLISVVHNSMLAAIKNFSSAYADRMRYFKWLLKFTDFGLIKSILLCLYKQKYKRHYNSLCRNSDAVVLLSEKFKEELLFFTGSLLLNNVTGIFNPVSFTEMKWAEKKKELLYVGRIDFSQKRVDLLLEIWSKLYEQLPDWSLRVVGGGAHLDDAIQLSSKLKLKNVYFEGFQNPQVYYKNASLFCMTSSFEGFGIVLVEAMQYGLVPFAFNSYLSVTDIIDNQINGVLIPPFDIDKYVLKLKQFMQDESKRIQFSEAAIEKSKEFSIDVIGNKWISLFEKLKKEN